MFLIAAREARGVVCAPPCGWCGGDGSQELMSGGVLHPSPWLDPARPIARVGAWLELSATTDSVRVVLSGDALDSGLLAPTALRLRTARASGQESWRGAALTGFTHEGSRCLTASVGGLRDVPARPTVIEVVGLCRREGEGELFLRFVVAAGGCFLCRTVVNVRAPSEPTVHGVSAKIDLPCALQARALAHFVDGVIGLMRRCGYDPSELTLRAARANRGTLWARVDTGPLGLSGAAWLGALKLASRGRCVGVSLYDQRHPDRAGIEVVPRVKGCAAPMELSAWLDASLMRPGGSSRWLDGAQSLGGGLTGLVAGVGQGPHWPGGLMS